jgi:hypothetical protein
MANIRITLASGVYANFPTYTVHTSLSLYITSMSVNIFSLMSVKVFFL